MCDNFPRVVRKAERPGLEPVTSWLQIRCPNHYATTPRKLIKPVTWLQKPTIIRTMMSLYTYIIKKYSVKL